MVELDFAKGYFVTRDGQVYSSKRGKLRKMSFTSVRGYKRLNLITNTGEEKAFLVHRLVAHCYIPNPENLPEVNHLDGNKQNNHVDNLEWCDRCRQQQHAFALGLNSNRGERNGRSILTEEDVTIIYSKLLNGEDIGSLSKEYNVSRGVISNIKRRTLWTHVTCGMEVIPLAPKPPKLEEGIAIKVCELLQGGYAPTQVFNLLRDDGVTLNQIYDIKRRRCFKHISEKYSW